MINDNVIQKLSQIKKLAEECIHDLSLEKAVLKKERIRKSLKIEATIPSKKDFNMSERAFIKKYSKNASGPKKFVLVLAYLVKGKAGKEISIKEIKKHWSKLTSLLKGEFNSYYSVKAKENNWVDSKKYGFYYLTPNWIEIFKK